MHKFKEYGKDQHKNKSATTIDIGPVETAIIGAHHPIIAAMKTVCLLT